MVALERLQELQEQVDAQGPATIDNRSTAYRVLTVLRVAPHRLEDVEELETACRQLVKRNPDQCLIEDDIDIARHAEDY